MAFPPDSATNRYSRRRQTTGIPQNSDPLAVAGSGIRLSLTMGGMSPPTSTR
ncbi:hypothetical protein [Gordonia oryzae]|uniref:hypothetical protein n=1 Tax=Gordonia oryzae TaxID=2487349 RepID=UPI00161E605A|nr:hypothetical protein [Gordonia oryzae]